MKEPKFKIGDKVKFKGKHELPNGKYRYGGDCQEGVIGEITNVRSFDVYSYNGYNGHDFKVKFKDKVNGNLRYYIMLEDEIVEYYSSTDLNMSIKGNKKSLDFNY